MADKNIIVVFYDRNFIKEEWRRVVDEKALDQLFVRLTKEMAPLGVQIHRIDDKDNSIDINGYGDILNSIRIRSPKDGIANMCLGHIIGKSAHLDLLEDIERGVNRAAFAPEMIEPEGSDKVVCHNCGCGC